MQRCISRIERFPREIDNNISDVNTFPRTVVKDLCNETLNVVIVLKTQHESPLTSNDVHLQVIEEFFLGAYIHEVDTLSTRF